ncbi:MAG: hypothetical protein V8S31_11595 [Lachnospiraceae bacterium]
MKEKQQGYTYGSYGGYGNSSSWNRQSYYGGGTQDAGSVEMQAAANYIANRCFKGHNVLNSMAASERNARWYYYSGLANAGVGNNIIARDHADRAVAMKQYGIPPAGSSTLSLAETGIRIWESPTDVLIRVPVVIV